MVIKNSCNGVGVGVGVGVGNEDVIHSSGGVVLASEGSLHICAGKVLVTEGALVVEESFFELTSRTCIPIESIKSIRKRSSLKNAAKITLYRQITGVENTLWEKKRRNFIFRDNRMCRMFINAVKGLRIFEDEDAEEKEEKEVGECKVTRRLNTTMTAKAMSLEDHLLLENSAEFRRFVDGEEIVAMGGVCEGVYWVDFGSVNVIGDREGENTILTQIPVGCSFGEMQFVLGSSLGENALVAEDEVVLKFWSKNTLTNLMEEKPSFGVGFMGTISNNIRSRLTSITAHASSDISSEKEGEKQQMEKEGPTITISKGTDTSVTTPEGSRWQKSYKCKMRKCTGNPVPTPNDSLSALPSNVSSAQRGTLVVDGRGVVFSYRVFGFKSKMRTTFHEINKGEITLKLIDFQGKPTVEVCKGTERTLFLGKRIKEAYQKMMDTRENLTSSVLSDDGSFSEENRPSDLRPDDWEKILKTSSQKKYTEGAIVLKEGEAAHSIYQVTKGSVKVVKQGRHMATLQEGAIFGEMSFLSWFTEGKDALVSADILAVGKVEMVCLDGVQLSALLFQNDGLCLRFFRYSVQLMSRRIENTIPMDGDWMKIWCPRIEIKSLESNTADLHTWLKKDLKFPSDIVSLYRKRLKDADFTTLQSLSIATDKELEKAGIAPIHRRKILWWVSNSGIFNEKGDRRLYLVTWMRKQMLWPEDVIEKYSTAFGEECTTVADMKKLGHEDLVQMGIAPIHRRKIAFWMTTHH